MTRQAELKAAADDNDKLSSKAAANSTTSSKIGQMATTSSKTAADGNDELKDSGR